MLNTEMSLNSLKYWRLPFRKISIKILNFNQNQSKKSLENFKTFFDNRRPNDLEKHFHSKEIQTTITTQNLCNLLFAQSSHSDIPSSSSLFTRVDTDFNKSGKT